MTSLFGEVTRAASRPAAVARDVVKVDRLISEIYRVLGQVRGDAGTFDGVTGG